MTVAGNEEEPGERANDLRLKQSTLKRLCIACIALFSVSVIFMLYEMSLSLLCSLHLPICTSCIYHVVLDWNFGGGGMQIVPTGPSRSSG